MLAQQAQSVRVERNAQWEIQLEVQAVLGARGATMHPLKEKGEGRGFPPLQ